MERIFSSASTRCVTSSKVMTPSSWLPSRAENSIVLAVGKRNEDLAVPAFAQRARQLPLDEACNPSARACRRPRLASASSGWIAPSSASGDLKRHQMRGFRIRHHDPAVRPEHDQAVRHGVERPVEALGDAVRLLFLR